MENEEKIKEKAIQKAIWMVKLGMIAFGYLILAMIQHTINPINFHWVATITFFLWVMIWLRASANRVN